MRAVHADTVSLAEVGNRHDSFLKFGAVAAIAGALIQVLSGISFRNLTNEYNAQSVLEILAARSPLSWPLIQLGFIAGTILWLFALIVLSWTLIEGRSWALGRLGAASIVLGATIHIVNSSISGYGLGTLARLWGDPSTDAGALVAVGDALQRVLGGTWSAVLIFFHGLPFVLYGLAVAFDPRYPTWVGWVGLVGGAGSVLTGVALLFAKFLIGPALPIVFAVVISLWMITMGVLMWQRAGDARFAP